MKTIALRHLAEINPATPEFDSVALDEPVTFLPLETVWSNGRADQDRTRPKSAVESGYTRFRAGDVVCPKVTPTFQAGRSMIAQSLGAGTTEIHVLRARRQVDPRWICYAVKSKPFLDEGVASFQGVAGLQRVPPEFVAQFRAADRGPDEQRRIADFLDDRVGRIDRIIAARHRQAILADQFFLSILERMVWTTEKCLPLKHLLADVTSGPRGWGGLVSDSGIPFIRIGNLSPLGIELDHRDLAMVSVPDGAEAERASLARHDVLLSITAAFGEVAVWRDGVGAFSQHVARLRPVIPQDSDWIAWLLQTPSVHDQYRLLAYGGTKIGMGLDQVRNILAPALDSAQRIRTAERVAEEWDTYRRGREAISDGVDLLTEYKSSLITAAVTGELDVTTAGSGVPG